MRAAITIACAALCLGEAAMAQRIVVVTSGDSPPYIDALSGIHKLGVPVQVLRVAADGTASAAPGIPAPQDGAIVTLGAAAGALALRERSGRPLVNCMMIGNEEAAPPVHTVPRLVPVDALLASLKRLLPHAQRVGLLFDPAQNERRAGDVASALQRAGYVPILEPVPTAKSLPGALGRLGDGVDVIVGLPDTTVYSREHMRAILLFSFRHRIPVVGPTEGWVSGGALYALDWDYADLGRYCGALALRELGGNKAPMPAAPRMRIVANARTAELLQVKWDTETLGSMNKVFP